MKWGAEIPENKITEMESAFQTGKYCQLGTLYVNFCILHILYIFCVLYLFRILVDIIISIIIIIITMHL